MMSEKIKALKKATALSYKAGENAPKVVAIGQGLLAEKIIVCAQENEIPVHQDEMLADALSGLRLGQEIPAELYQVVAKILIYVCDMDRLMGAK